MNGRNSPPEPNVPRVLCTNTWKPRRTIGSANATPTSPARPYGERISTTGIGADGPGR